METVAKDITAPLPPNGKKTSQYISEIAIRLLLAVLQ